MGREEIKTALTLSQPKFGIGISSPARVVILSPQSLVCENGV
jgi:hypothetical protein